MKVDEQTARILIMEDAPATIDLVRTSLEGKGRQVFVATSEDNAADKAELIRPDLILMDIVMPGLNGFEAFRRLKSRTETRDVPVIFMSSRTETIDKLHGLDMGCVDYINKPLDMAELLSRVKTHLKIGRLQRELTGLNTKLEERVLARTRALNKVNQDLRREIEERKNAEEALREKAAELFAIYENTPLVMMLVDEDQRILKANRAAAGAAMLPLEEITGLSVGVAIKCIDAREEPEDCGLGKHCRDCVVRGAILETFETGVPHHRQEALLRIDRGDGPADRFVLVYTARLKIDGRASVLVYIEELTEHKRLESQLRQARKMESLGALTGGVAHDLNNILMAILGNTEIMEMFDRPDDAKARSGLKEVIRAANRAKDMVLQILSFSRRTEKERVELPLIPLVKETIRFIRASTPSTIEIRLNAEIENDAVYADPTRMHQVLMNLCANASHAMRAAGGLLEVTLEPSAVDEAAAIHFPDLPPGDYVKLSVSDSGHGITPGVIDRIFEPFFTTKKKGEGTGMGLSMVHGIVKSYGGAISVKSEPGKGSIFSVYYPAVSTMTETRISSEFERFPRGRERILVVDDDRSILKMVEYTLRRLGYTVVVKMNGVEALEYFLSAPDQFDLVITDHFMPHVTGMELAKSIREFEADIPIILYTGFSGKVSEEKALAAGIQKFLLKPLGARDIAHAVREVLDHGGPVIGEGPVKGR